MLGVLVQKVAGRHVSSQSVLQSKGLEFGAGLQAPLPARYLTSCSDKAGQHSSQARYLLYHHHLPFVPTYM